MRLYTVVMRMRMIDYPMVVYFSREECLEYIARQRPILSGGYGVYEHRIGQEIDLFNTVEWISDNLVKE